MLAEFTMDELAGSPDPVQRIRSALAVKHVLVTGCPPLVRNETLEEFLGMTCGIEVVGKLCSAIPGGY